MSGRKAITPRMTPKDIERAREVYGQLIEPSAEPFRERVQIREGNIAAIAAALAKVREECALECERLYARERELVNKAADQTPPDDESFHFHKRRGDGFFESAKAIRALSRPPADGGNG